MTGKTLFALLSIAAWGLTSLSAIAKSANDADTFIQGGWRVKGQLPKDQGGHSMSWFLEWRFADGTFSQAGYPPIAQEGKYRVVSREQDTLRLELYQQAGNFGGDDRQIEIVVDREHETLKISGEDGFARIKNQE